MTNDKSIGVPTLFIASFKYRLVYNKALRYTVRFSEFWHITLIFGHLQCHLLITLHLSIQTQEMYVTESIHWDWKARCASCKYCIIPITHHTCTILIGLNCTLYIIWFRWTQWERERFNGCWYRGDYKEAWLAICIIG